MASVPMPQARNVVERITGRRRRSAEKPDVGNSFQARLLLKEAEEHMDLNPATPWLPKQKENQPHRAGSSAGTNHHLGLTDSSLHLTLTRSKLRAQERQSGGCSQQQGLVKQNKDPGYRQRDAFDCLMTCISPPAFEEQSVKVTAG